MTSFSQFSCIAMESYLKPKRALMFTTFSKKLNTQCTVTNKHENIPEYTNQHICLKRLTAKHLLQKINSF